MLREAFAKHPILLTTVLFFVALIAAVPPMLALRALLPEDWASSLARLAVALVMFALFRDRVDWGRSFSGIALAIPVLGFVAWNLIYNGMSGGELVGGTGLTTALVVALGPAFSEEIIFRGVGIQALRDHGYTNMQVMLLSALPFGLIHLTNAVGNPLADTLVQVAYALVIGFVFAGIYLASNDLATTILAHFAIDCSSHIFLNAPKTESVPVLVAFAVLLAAETAYAIWLARKSEE